MDVAISAVGNIAMRIFTLNSTQRILLLLLIDRHFPVPIRFQNIFNLIKIFVVKPSWGVGNKQAHQSTTSTNEMNAEIFYDSSAKKQKKKETKQAYSRDDDADDDDDDRRRATTAKNVRSINNNGMPTNKTVCHQ